MKSGYSFIDAGANVGVHTLLAASMRKDDSQKIFSFEPQEDIFEILKKNIDINKFKNVIAINKGLGESVKKKKIYVPNDYNKGRASFLEIDNAKETSDEILMTTLDSNFAEDFKNEKVLIKADVEGYEYFLLKGGKNFLSINKNISIICEMWLNNIDRKLNGKLIIDFLKRVGFDKHFIINDLMFQRYGVLGFNMLSQKNSKDAEKIEIKNDKLIELDVAIFNP